MSWLLRIIALLSQLQNNVLVQEIEQCVLTNTTPATIWQCILGKLAAQQNLPPADAAMIDAAKSLATAAKL